MKKKSASLLFCSAVLSGLAATAADRFAIQDIGGDRVMVLENGKPYLVYNFGPQLLKGVPEDRKRCCYIFPVYTPDGVSVTDDFPKDHYHHRGLFWAWPEIETSTGIYDLWTLKGAEHRFKRWLEQESGETGASLTVDNGWYIKGKEVALENVHISIHPSASAQRDFSVTLTITANQPLTIRGSQDNSKGYGGFSARFAPRQDTIIRTDKGVLAGDEDHVRHDWAELEASYSGKKAVLRITSEASNPGAPYEWCLRQYGFVGANFPGVSGFRLEPLKPLILKFRVSLRDLP
ncbi:MAG: PmoA family protein [Bryobacterales bacterium]|nr:PmoA family protein [Bryobacterales bacterium]